MLWRSTAAGLNERGLLSIHGDGAWNVLFPMGRIAVAGCVEPKASSHTSREGRGDDRFAGSRLGAGD